MKLSKDTLAIIKNLGSINPNLIIQEGSKLRTLAASRTMMAEAVVEESFPMDFGIYDLNEFLGTLSLFESPDLEFNSKFVTIKEGHNSVKYFAAAPNVLTEVPTLKPFPDVDIEFVLTQQMLQQILKVSSILKVSDFSFVGDGETVSVVVGDKSNATGNTFTSEIGTTDKTFKVFFKVENMKMMPGDYTVSIGGKKKSRFQSNDRQLVYHCAIELDSTFDF